MDAIAAFFDQYGLLLLKGTWDTIVMTSAGTFFAYVFGVPIGVAIVLTSPVGLHPHRIFNGVLGWIVNMGRSIPFIILLVALIPFTRWIVGTSLGVAGAIVPLTVAAAPFVGRMVEQSLSEVNDGLIEAAQSFGASTLQIVFKVLLKESLPSLIRGAAITFITLFGYTAIAGTIGAGGLGDIAVRYGYHRYQGDVMIAAVIICIILVQLVQSVSDILARKIDKRN
jgi:D-methionine transport system permease protein